MILTQERQSKKMEKYVRVKRRMRGEKEWWYKVEDENEGR